MTTSSTSEAWTRDHAADANPDLVRKRLRQSEDIDASPLSSSNGSVVIEVIDSAPSGTNLDNAIQVDDDPIMESCSESFDVFDPNINPMLQLERLGRKIETGHCLDPHIIIALADWLHSHVTATAGDATLWRATYLREEDFFALLGDVVFLMLARTENIIDPRMAAGTYQLRAAVERLYESLTSLSTRILICLPPVVETTISRRDSANPLTPRPRIRLLTYVGILAQMLSFRKLVASHFFKECVALAPEAVAGSCYEVFLQEPLAKPALISLLKHLGSAHSEVAEEWETIDALLWLLHRSELCFKEELGVVLDIARARVLPVVCERHPRTLPEMFLDTFIGTASLAIKALMRDTGIEGASLVYQRYVRGDDDALLPETTEATSVPTLLTNLVDKHPGVLAKLMTTAWVLQVLKRLIFSDIMDVRSQGVALLSNRLQSTWVRHHATHPEGDHPVLQYVARFMRVNELTKYILGPNSHASLVNHSQEIVGFLAITGSFTELEADIIWHACTTSVEAEFVRASFGILSFLYKWLSMDHLQYLAQKYMVTSPSKIGRDAVESLYSLLAQMNAVANRVDDQQYRLAYPFTCIGILKHVTNSPEAPSSEPISRLVKGGLTEFAGVRVRAEDRIQIYDVCVSDILHLTVSATTSIEILLLFLRRQPTLQEAEWLTTNLPTHALSCELAHFVESLPVSSDHPSHSILTAIGLRIEVMIRLLSFQPAALAVPGSAFLHSFYSHIAGDKAIHNHAREAAWVSLAQLASIDTVADVATCVVHRFAVEEAMGLPPENITPQLVELWSAALMSEIVAEDTNGATVDFLSMSLWQKLVEAAEGPTSIPSHQLAIEMICRILSGNALRVLYLEAPRSLDAEFTDRQIARLCSHYRTYSQSKQDEDGAKIVRGIDILDAILSKSRHPSYTEQDSHTSRIDLTGETGDDVLSCVLRIRPGRDVGLRVSGALTIYDLVTRLRGITRAPEHRVFVAGESIDLQTKASISVRQLSESHSGAIMISPQYPCPSDIHKLPAMPGRVEEQVLAHFPDLETLLTGPELIGEKMYQFLSKIHPPVAARERFMTQDTTAADIFPPSHTWQSIYYVFVLKNQLLDSRHADKPDEQFLRRCVRLLVTILIDEKWPVQPYLYVRVMDCLALFLEDCIDLTLSEVLIEDADRFTSRMIDLCFWAAGGAMDTSPTEKMKLVDCAVRCVFLFFRIQESVWQSFTQHDRFVELNKTLLLCSERSISASTAAAIGRLCLEPDVKSDIVDHYMNVLIAILPDALGYGYMSIDHSLITTEVILVNKVAMTETRARALVETVNSHLRSYDHTESVDLPLVDPAVVGLLRIFSAALDVLKSFKKPLGLPGLSTSLFKRFLFPQLNDVDSKPLVDPKTRQLVYDLVTSTCRSFDDVVELLTELTTPLYDAQHEPSATYPGRAGWLRPASKCTGLTNLGMTCYMNSLLQQLFSNIQFRKFIFDTAAADPDKQSFLFEVQKLFSSMQDEYHCFADTTALAQNLGTCIDNQEDVHGFYEEFLSRLEANMPDRTSKEQLSKFFTGKLMSQIKGECGHVSPKPDLFLDLPILVKNKPSLRDSLDEFVQGEPMEGTNRYRCQACDPEGGGRLVNAMKRTCLEELPENVTFCLKRFTFEAMYGMEGKVNDRFEFPETIDLSRYLWEHLENPAADVAPDIFELVGVIVHQGTLQIGHYWSYTLLRSSQGPDDRIWVKLEDNNVSRVDGIAEIQRECFGGQVFSSGGQRSDNAYVLFYQRKSSLDGQMARSSDRLFESGIPLPPKAAIPAALKRSIHESNCWRQRIAQIFDDEFARTVEMVLSLLRGYMTPGASSESDDSRSEDGSPETSMDPDRPADDELLYRFSALGMTHLLRVATCDANAPQKVDGILKELRSMVSEQPKAVSKLLDRFFQSPLSFQGVMTHTSESVRTHIFNFVLRCLACLREQDQESYERTINQIKRIFSTTLGSALDLSRVNWTTMFGFAAKLARVGVEETKAVLDTDSLRWSFEVLHLQCGRATTQKNVRLLELIQNNPSRVSALYSFIADILSGHVDLSEEVDSVGPHLIGEDGVLLHRVEAGYLSQKSYDGMLSWVWLARFAETKRDWREFAPGKLVALFMTHEELQGVGRKLAESLQRLNEKEEQYLNVIFHLTLRFCAESGDVVAASNVFNALANTFCEWERALDILGFLQQAYLLVPEIAVQGVHYWCDHYLMHRSRKVQQHTEQWLQEAVFQSSFTSGYSVLDAYRVRQIRKIVPRICLQAKSAYSEERPRARFEGLINLLRSAASYLKSLRASIKAHLESSDADVNAKVGPELRVEYDESGPSLVALEDALQYLADWVSDEDGMPSSTLDHVSRSVETVSEDPETSEEEMWELDGEQA